MDITEEEELQAKEFLKRAEIKTMRKDLQKLREADAIVERDKIVKMKTVEEERLEILKKKEDERIKKEGLQREEILRRGENEEREAEKQIKDYAQETEKQQIFLLESQRLGLEKQLDAFEKEKEPAIALEKNRLLIEKRDWEAKLKDSVLEEKKAEGEQSFLEEKEKTSNVPSEKKSLEERRRELEDQRQKIEKKRWAIEKEIKEIEDSVKKMDSDYQSITEEKNILKQKISGINKSLRDIYSQIIKRVEDQKKGQAEEQKVKEEERQKIAGKKKETIQREQWSHAPQPEKGFLKEIPSAAKEKLAKSTQIEEDQRKKFLEDVEKQTSEASEKKQ